MSAQYKNRAELEVHACGEVHVIYSNEVEAQKIIIRVEKSQNKNCVFAGDCLEYTVKICNDSEVDIIDAIFCDQIPAGLEFLENTFKVDGNVKVPTLHLADNKISYQIDEIKAWSEVVICFSTCVL